MAAAQDQQTSCAKVVACTTCQDTGWRLFKKNFGAGPVEWFYCRCEMAKLLVREMDFVQWIVCPLLEIEVPDLKNSPRRSMAG